MASKQDSVTLTRLNVFATKHGVELKKVTKEDILSLERESAQKRTSAREYNAAPFDNYLGINWDKKIVYYVDDVQWPAIIHELGHLLATKKRPWECVEFDFFGWELAVVSEIGGSIDRWLESNHEYGVGDYEELGSLGTMRLFATLNERLVNAQKLGIIDEDGYPVSVR